MKLATQDDVREVYAELSERVAESREAVSGHLDRALRRMVLTLGALLVAAGTTLVLWAWSVY